MIQASSFKVWPYDDELKTVTIILIVIAIELGLLLAFNIFKYIKSKK